ncbi:hypothetical protein [Methanosphaera sp.]
MADDEIKLVPLKNIALVFNGLPLSRYRKTLNLKKYSIISSSKNNNIIDLKENFTDIISEGLNLEFAPNITINHVFQFSKEIKNKIDNKAPEKQEHTIEQLYFNHFQFKEELLSKELDELKYKKYFLHENDIIIKTQQPNTIHYNQGKTKTDTTGIISSGYAIIRLDPDSYDQYHPDYIYQALKSPYVANQIRKASSGTRSILSINNLKEIKIPILPLDKQDEYTHLIELIDDKIINLSKLITEEQKLKNTILTKMLEESNFKGDMDD